MSIAKAGPVFSLALPLSVAPIDGNVRRSSGLAVYDGRAGRSLPSADGVVLTCPISQSHRKCERSLIPRKQPREILNRPLDQC